MGDEGWEQDDGGGGDGGTYEFDVFLSYRVSTDKELVRDLCEKLTRKGLRVYLDQKEIKVGTNWKKSFCKAVLHSKVVVLVVSRGTFRCQHLCKGSTGGACAQKCRNNLWDVDAENGDDNVLLEHDLALELFDLGRVRKIFPLLVGDVMPAQRFLDDDQTVYTDFFKTECLNVGAHIPGKVLKKMQLEALDIIQEDPYLRYKLRSNTLTNHSGLASTPSLKSGRRTARQTLSAIMNLQGFKLTGDSSLAVTTAGIDRNGVCGCVCARVCVRVFVCVNKERNVPLILFLICWSRERKEESRSRCALPYLPVQTHSLSLSLARSLDEDVRACSGKDDFGGRGGGRQRIEPGHGLVAGM